VSNVILISFVPPVLRQTCIPLGGCFIGKMNVS
jgi:hypothetical protein